jgi:hypothetical protein
MGVARQPAARPVISVHLEPEPVEVFCLQAVLKKGPRVDAGGGVALHVDVVAGSALLSTEEVVEANVVEPCG